MYIIYEAAYNYSFCIVLACIGLHFEVCLLHWLVLVCLGWFVFGCIELFSKLSNKEFVLHYCIGPYWFALQCIGWFALRCIELYSKLSNTECVLHYYCIGPYWYALVGLHRNAEVGLH